MPGEGFNPFGFAQNQFDRAADFLGLETAVRDLLRRPLRECRFSIPVRMDDGGVKVFEGFRVLHNDARGPANGGIRFHPQETLDTVRAHAMWMTWKCAVADLPLGGSNGGVICDLHHISLQEQERLCRGWIRQLFGDIGPRTDVPAPDVMTNAQHMLWMLDEYETISRVKTPGCITGKPVALGGSLGRIEATGYGVIYMVREALKELDMAPEETRASVQGFGHVAQHAIRLYQQIGGKVTCVSCQAPRDKTCHTVRKEDGIDLDALLHITDGFGSIDGNKARELGYEVLPGDAWIDQKVDILLPAALENQITDENAGRIQPTVKIIAEGANGPTTPKADHRLNDRGVYVLPDFLANAGGMICSYFEQVQCNANYFWEKDEVLSKLDVKMTAAFSTVNELAMKRKITLREAAYYIAVDRVARACRERGWV